MQQNLGFVSQDSFLSMTVQSWYSVSKCNQLQFLLQQQTSNIILMEHMMLWDKCLSMEWFCLDMIYRKGTRLKIVGGTLGEMLDMGMFQKILEYLIIQYIQ